MNPSLFTKQVKSYRELNKCTSTSAPDVQQWRQRFVPFIILPLIHMNQTLFPQASEVL